MIGLPEEERVEHGDSFLSCREGFFGRGFSGQQRQAVKGARLKVAGILLVELPHCVRISGDALHVVVGAVVAVEVGKRGNIAPLTVGLGAELLSFVYLAPATLQGRFAGALPYL